MERYRDVSLKYNKPFIFHSSHYRICKNPNAINITTVHDFTYERYRKGLAKWVHSWQKNKAIRKADVVVCISESTKRDVLHFVPEISEEKIRVIYNGVSSDYKPVCSKSYSFLGKYIVFVGSRQAYKKFDFLVESLSSTFYNLAIVGGPLNDDEYKLLDDKLGNDRYYYMGYLSNMQLNELYNQAVCLVYPSLYEGFGIPILEAQKAGCPVIALNASSVPEIIGSTPLLLNSLTTAELHSKLEILENETIRNEIIIEGYKNAEKFSWTKMGQDYVTLYKEIMKKKLL